MTTTTELPPIIAVPYEVDLTIASPYQPWHPVVLAGVCDGVEEQTGVRLRPEQLGPPKQIGRMAQGHLTLARQYRWTGTVVTQPPTTRRH